MAHERYTNIMLDGRNATLSADGTEMTWNTPEYYFKDVSEKDDIYLSLMHAQYLGVDAGMNTWAGVQSEVLLKSSKLSNTTNTSNDVIIGMFDNAVDPTVGINTVQSTNKNYVKDMHMKIQKFNEITLCVRHQGDYLDFTTNANGINKDYNKFYIQLKNYIDKEQTDLTNNQNQYAK